MRKKLVSCIVFLIMMTVFTPVYALNENEIVLTYFICFDDAGTEIQPRASTTYKRTSGQKSFKDTKNNIEMSCHATLTVTIRVNEATGVITSYDDPVLNVYDCYTRGFETFSENISTSCSLSSTRRTLNCVGNFNLYARSGTGVRMATSKQFTISFNAG